MQHSLGAAGDVFDAFGYMKEHGLPDESCMTYSATDHSNVTADWKKLKSCPLDAVCRNCMPLNDTDPGTCWAVKAPVLYKLASYGKVEPPGEHGGCRGCSALPALRSPGAFSGLRLSTCHGSAESPCSQPEPRTTQPPNPAATHAGMMSEIYQRGPITCSIATPDSFVYGYR